MIIRVVQRGDARTLAQIYNHYILHTDVTFEEQPLNDAQMQARVDEVLGNDLPWLVMEDDAGAVVGYSYANKWGKRVGYRYSVESSIYLAHDCTGKGLGRKLYQALFDALAKTPTHLVLAGITLPNEASVRLQEAFGMKKVAHFNEVGFRHGRWLDVGYWQKTLKPLRH